MQESQHIVEHTLAAEKIDADTLPSITLKAVAEEAFELVYAAEDSPLPPPPPVRNLAGHKNKVTSLGFSPNGKLLLTASKGTLRLWDVDKASFVRMKRAHDDEIEAAIFIDDHHVLSASRDRTLKVWHLPDFALVRTLEGHQGAVRRVCLAGPGRAVSGGEDDAIRSWDLETGQTIRTFASERASALAVSPDHRRLVAFSRSNVLRIWNLEDGELLHEVRATPISRPQVVTEHPFRVGHLQAPDQAVFTPDGQSFVSEGYGLANEGSEIIVWDLAAGTQRFRSPPLRFSGQFHGFAVLPNDERGAATPLRLLFAFENVLDVVELESGVSLAKAAWSHGILRPVSSPDGRWVACGSEEGIVGLWDLPAVLAAKAPEHHLTPIMAMAVSCDGRVLTTAKDRSTRLWTPNGSSAVVLPQSDELDFSPDGAKGVVIAQSSSYGGSLEVIDAQHGTLLARVADPPETFYPTDERQFLRTGEMLAAGAKGPLTLWSVDPTAKPSPFEGDAGHVTAIAADESAGLVATATPSFFGKPPWVTIKLWDLARRSLKVEIRLRPGKKDKADDLHVRAIAVVGDRVVVIINSLVLLFDDRGAILRAWDVSHGWGLLRLSDGKRVIANGVVVDVATCSVVSVLRWPEGVGVYWNGATATASVASAEGLALADVARGTLSAFTKIQPIWSIKTSHGAEFVALRSSAPESQCRPTLLRRRVALASTMEGFDQLLAGAESQAVATEPVRRFEFVSGTSSKFWEISVVGTALRLAWGKIGTKGQTKTKEFASSEAAIQETEPLVAKKLKEGYREITKAAAPSKEPIARNPKIVALVEELRALGANVEFAETPCTEEAIAAAEKSYGFAFPDEYKQFLAQWGFLHIEYDRTWFFYGLEQPDYSGLGEIELHEDDDDDDDDYFPSRYIVLYDEGDFSNAASGLVYDADLGGMIFTDGYRPLDRADVDASPGSYWDYATEYLTEIRDRIADPDDMLVSGGKKQLAMHRRARSEALKTPMQQAAALVLAKCIDELYRLFERYTLPPLPPDLMTAKEEELVETPLRKLEGEVLFDLAYSNIHTISKGERDIERYKHFIPRVLEALDEIALKGNPSVVIPQVFYNIFRTELTRAEEAAVLASLDAIWESLLLDAGTKLELIEAFLVARGELLGRLLAKWTSIDSNEPIAHLKALIGHIDFSKGAKYYGWQDGPFEELRNFARSDNVRKRTSSWWASTRGHAARQVDEKEAVAATPAETAAIEERTRSAIAKFRKKASLAEVGGVVVDVDVAPGRARSLGGSIYLTLRIVHGGVSSEEEVRFASLTTKNLEAFVDGWAQALTAILKRAKTINASFLAFPDITNAKDALGFAEKFLAGAEERASEEDI